VRPRFEAFERLRRPDVVTLRLRNSYPAVAVFIDGSLMNAMLFVDFCFFLFFSFVFCFVQLMLFVFFLFFLIFLFFFFLFFLVYFFLKRGWMATTTWERGLLSNAGGHEGFAFDAIGDVLIACQPSAVGHRPVIDRSNRPSGVVLKTLLPRAKCSKMRASAVNIAGE